MCPSSLIGLLLAAATHHVLAALPGCLQAWDAQVALAQRSAERKEALAAMVDARWSAQQQQGPASGAPAAVVGAGSSRA